MARKKSLKDAMEKEKIKKIMARPVSPQKTPLYWIAKGRFVLDY